MRSLITQEKLSAENIDQAQLSSLQPVIQRDLNALTLFGSDLDTLANSIDHRISFLSLRLFAFLFQHLEGEFQHQ